mgnify:CR=1 FL=1
MKQVKFNPQLVRGNILKELEENDKSLKERYATEEKVELKIEPKLVQLARKVWNGLLTVAGAFFSLLGLMTLIHPLLRTRLIAVFIQFFTEAGLL